MIEILDVDEGFVTETDENGNWCVHGIRWNELHVGQVITEELCSNLYGALSKLRDYEESGLQPDEVEKLAMHISENKKD